MSNIIRFEYVSKNFGNVPALQDLSFNIPNNKIVGLIGANGAGKTTSMRLIIRYLQQDSGNIYYKDTPIHSLRDDAFPITYVPDTPIFYEELSVLEHMVLISSMYNTQKNKDILINILALTEHLDKVPSMLSKGNKQKLNIACALLRNYDVLIADEPFSGLDPRQIKVFKDIILENKYIGKSVLISTHLLDMIDTLCDEFIMIDHGRLLAQGTLEQLVTNNPTCDSLEDIYLALSANSDSESAEEE